MELSAFETLVVIWAGEPMTQKASELIASSAISCAGLTVSEAQQPCKSHMGHGPDSHNAVVARGRPDCDSCFGNLEELS